MNDTNTDDGTRIETFENLRVSVEELPDNPNHGYYIKGEGGQLAKHMASDIETIRLNGARLSVHGMAKFDARTHSGTDLISVEVREGDDGHREANIRIGDTEDDA